MLLQPDSQFIFQYRCIRGQLLNIPTKEGFILEGPAETQRKYTVLPDSVCINTQEDVRRFCTTTATSIMEQLRMDPEPCWDSDVQTVSINVRIGGRPTIQLSPSKLSSAWSDTRLKRVSCDCTPEQPCLGLSTIEHLLTSVGGCRWYTIPLQEMIQQGKLIWSEDRTSDRSPTCMHWLVHTHGNATVLALALAVSFSSGRAPQQIMITNCIGAALTSHLFNPNQVKESTMIILHLETIFQDFHTLDHLHEASQLIEAAAHISPIKPIPKVGEQQIERLIELGTRHPSDHQLCFTIGEVLDRLIASRSEGHINQDGILTVLRALENRGSVQINFTGVHINIAQIRAATTTEVDKQISAWKGAHPEYVRTPVPAPRPSGKDLEPRFRALHRISGWYSREA